MLFLIFLKLQLPLLLHPLRIPLVLFGLGVYHKVLARVSRTQLLIGDAGFAEVLDLVHEDQLFFGLGRDCADLVFVHAYLRILGRHATAKEIALSQKFLKSVIETTENGRGEAWTQMVQSLFSTLEFRYVR